jgi:hypothetical protein
MLVLNVFPFNLNNWSGWLFDWNIVNNPNLFIEILSTCRAQQRQRMLNQLLKLLLFQVIDYCI